MCGSTVKLSLSKNVVAHDLESYRLWLLNWLLLLSCSSFLGRYLFDFFLLYFGFGLRIDFTTLLAFLWTLGNSPHNSVEKRGSKGLELFFLESLLFKCKIDILLHLVLNVELLHGFLERLVMLGHSCCGCRLGTTCLSFTLLSSHFSFRLLAFLHMRQALNLFY